MNGFVRARVDEDIRASAAAVLDSVGLNVSDIVRVVLTRIAKEKMIPIGLFTPNAVTIAAMEEAREITNNRRMNFKTAQEMFNALEKEDNE